MERMLRISSIFSFKIDFLILNSNRSLWMNSSNAGGWSEFDEWIELIRRLSSLGGLNESKRQIKFSLCCQWFVFMMTYSLLCRKVRSNRKLSRKMTCQWQATAAFPKKFLLLRRAISFIISEISRHVRSQQCVCSMTTIFTFLARSFFPAWSKLV